MTQINKIKGHCPNCGPGINSDVVASHIEKWSEDVHSTWGQYDYRILKCCGCDKVYYQTEMIFSEDFDHEYNHSTREWETVLISKFSYWPAPTKRTKPEWIGGLYYFDEILHSIMSEVYTALDNDLKVSAAVGIRTSFDRATELLGIDPTIFHAVTLGESFTGLGK